MINSVLSYLALGQYESAAALCEQAIVDAPEQLTPYWYLGVVRLLQSDHAEAQAVWLSATMALDAMAVEAGLEELLGILQAETARQLQLGQPDLAECLSLQALELDANRAHTCWQLGHAVALQGRLDEAIEYWQAAIERQPDWVEPYCQQAEVFQKLEQWDEAIAAYQQVIALQPTWETHYNLGLCLGKCQHWQAAIEQFTEAILLRPDLASTYGDRGWAALQLGHWQAALADFQIALGKQSTYAQTYLNWVQAWEQTTESSTPAQRAEVLRLLCLPNPELAYQALSQWSDLQRQNGRSNQQESRNSTDQTTLEQPSQQQHNAFSVTASSPTFYETTQAWAEFQEATDREINDYIQLDPPSFIPLTLPKTIDRQPHFSFRFGAALPLPGTFVATIPNGRFWLNANQTCSAIFTAEHQLLGDLSPEFPLLSPGHPDKRTSNHSYLALDLCSEQFPPIQSINGTVAVLSGLTNDLYFHWMFDTLPRIDLLARSGIALDRIDYFLVSHHLPFQQETLKILGIPAAKILETSKHLQIQADRLIVPSYPSSPAWPAKWVCQWLRRVFLSHVEPSISRGDRIYITRQNATNRRIINEREVRDLLSQFGFQCVALESLSVMEQAALLAKAEVIVAPHGGGLTNTVFCQPGTKVIEIFSPQYVYVCYWLISNLVELDYYYLTGIVPEGYYLHHFLYPDARTEDIWVDLRDLSNVLNLAGVV